MRYRVLNFLIRAAEARVPQMIAVVLGLMGAGTGLLFLLRPERFMASASMSSVIKFAPTTIWGVVFLIAGACLINTALVSQSRTFWYCFALGRLMALFTLLSGLDVAGGSGIGLVALYTLGYGLLCDITGLAAVAPGLKRYVRSHDETIGAEITG